MVRGQEGWFSMPSYRNSRARNSAGKEYTKKKIAGGKNKKAKATYEKCGGKIKGVFTKTGFYFVPHGTTGHACQLQHGGRRSNPDICPPLLLITVAASWGLTNKMLTNMKEALKSCPAVWWTPLPKQKTTRHWLQRIGEAVTPREKLVKRQVELLLDPFLWYVKFIYPEMRYWKVGALKTKGQTPSQYELWGNKLHTNYLEAVLSRPPQERPMSIIMALDKFLFYFKTTMPGSAVGTSAKDYDTVTMQRGQAVAFTYKQLHAGGPNDGTEEVYRLFAYIVSDEADYPPNEVFPETDCRKARRSTARLDDEMVEHSVRLGRL
jgi:hypothetical protein